MKSAIEPYLFFSGRCDEALQFYQAAVGAKVEMLMRYSESPHPIPPGSIPPGFENKVMHSTFRVGESVLHASDGNEEKSKFSGITLSLKVENEAEATRVFAALADGGSVTLPLSKTFWSPCFGMLEDRFGLGWMITVF